MNCEICGREVVRRTPDEIKTAIEGGNEAYEYAHFQRAPNGYGFLYPARDGHVPNPEGVTA